MNPAFIQQTGLMNATGRTMRELAPAHESHWFERYGRVALTGESVRFEAPAEALGRYYDVYAFRVGAPEERRVAVLFDDVSASKATERERERLFAELQEANTELRRLNAKARAAERRSAFLAEVAAASQSLTDPDLLMATTARMLGEYLGVDRCAYAEVEADEDHFVITGDYTRGDTNSIVGRFTFRSFGGEVLRLMRVNQAYVMDDAETDPRVMVDDLPAYHRTQIRAAICVPLHKDGRFVAAMAVHQRVPRDWTAEEVDLVVTLVRRCWESLERARAYRSLREREAALQAASAQLVDRTAAAERALQIAEGAHQAAEAASRAKSDFLAIMSHELRTPLNAIGGYAELLELGIHGPVNADQRQALERIQQSQRHLLGLINQVLNYTRIDAGVVRYDLTDIGVGEALTAAELLVLPQMRARGLRYAHDVCEASLIVRADREKLQQVLLNLLTNAIKFTEPGGEVRVSCMPRESVIAIAVSDTGIGIAPEKLPTIFEPFVQVDQRHTRAHEGVGLGLAISRDLARGMGGDLVAESVPGEGSVFTLTIPRVRGTSSRAAAAHD
jgi:signal transduction histidine kinase